MGRFIVSLCMIGAFIIVVLAQAFRFDADVYGHVYLAYMSNHPKDAINQIDLALKGLEKHKITCDVPGEEYTSVFWNSPSDDIGFFIHNLKQTRGNLASLPANSDHLTISNTMMQARESLGSSPPGGLSLYPYNREITILFVVLLCFFMYSFYRFVEEY